MGNSCGGLDEYWRAIRTHPRAAGRLRLGLGRSGARAGARRRHRAARVRRRLRRRAQRRRVLLRRPGRGRSHAASVAAGAREGHPTGADPRGRRGPRRARRHERARVRRPRVAAAVVGRCTSTARRSRAGELDAARRRARARRARSTCRSRRSTLGARAARAPHGLVPHARTICAWAAAGHEVAWEQVELGVGSGSRTRRPDRRPRSARSLESLEPTIALWRAPIDNETFGPGHAAALGTPRPPRRAARTSTRRTRGRPTTRAAAWSRTRVEVPDALDDIPRVGVRLRLGPGVHAVEWLGDGPHECYSDRRASARVRALDHAGRRLAGAATCTRRRAATARACAGSASSTRDGDPCSSSTSSTTSRSRSRRVTDEEVADAGHLEDLPVRDDCYVWIDARQRGVGSARVRSRHGARAPHRSRHVPLVVPPAIGADRP